MKTPDWNRNELLDDVLGEENERDIPDEKRMLALIRSEKRARKRRRCITNAAACMALMIATITLVWHIGNSPEGQRSKLSSGTSLLSDPEAASQEIKIEQIGDEELLALLADQPAALVRFPGGERRLMLVVGNHSTSVP